MSVTEPTADVERLQSLWSVTPYDEAVRLTEDLDDTTLRALLELEHENGSRPRYRVLLRQRIDGRPVPAVDPSAVDLR